MHRLSLLPFAMGVVLLASGCGGEPATEPTIAIHYSRFTPGVLEVPVGRPVTFTLRNDDPIEHEWIVGLSDVHDVHRTGVEAFHGELPTEVTVPAFSVRETIVTFDETGEYEFICHLPGHEAYGMVGTVRVVEA